MCFPHCLFSLSLSLLDTSKEKIFGCNFHGGSGGAKPSPVQDQFQREGSSKYIFNVPFYSVCIEEKWKIYFTTSIKKQFLRHWADLPQIFVNPCHDNNKKGNEEISIKAIK